MANFRKLRKNFQIFDKNRIKCGTKSIIESSVLPFMIFHERKSQKILWLNNAGGFYGFQKRRNSDMFSYRCSKQTCSKIWTLMAPFQNKSKIFDFGKSDFRGISGQFVLSDIVIFGTCQAKNHKHLTIQLRIW